MAKTLEELKEAIQNVIAENDKGEITATALQTILLDMSETLSELGGNKDDDNYIIIASTLDIGSDGNPIIILNDEDKAHNKKIYDKLLEKPFPVLVSMRAYNTYPGNKGDYKVYDFVPTMYYSMIFEEGDIKVPEDDKFIGTDVIIFNGEVEFTLFNDGSIRSNE